MGLGVQGQGDEWGGGVVIPSLLFDFDTLLFDSDTEIKSRITKLEDMKNRRLEHLRNRYKDAYNAVMWLRDNQHLFQAPVHEPILLQVSFCIPWSRIYDNVALVLLHV